MKVQLRGHNFELTEANRQYAIDKAAHLERFFQNEQINGTVTIKKFQRTVKVEVMLSGSKNLHIRAEEVNEDLYAAIDIVIEKLEKQIRKHKTKLQKHHQDKMPLSDWFIQEQNETEAKPGKLVREKELEISKPMNIDEAILQMLMLGHNFYLYKDQDSMNVNLLYKRNDGNIGLIKTK